MMPRPQLAILAAAVLSAALASAADAGQLRYDLAGTWTGKVTCKTFNGGAKDAFTLTPTMRISQGGLEVGIQLLYGNGDIERYAGVANPDVKKPLEKGELVVVACGTNDQVGDQPVYDEIGRMAISTKPPKVKASFKGTSIFSDPGFFPAEVGTCKWKWTRIDRNEPGIQTVCGVPGLTLPPTP